MTNLLPLVLMWMWSQRNGSSAPQSNVPQPPLPPQWPTSSSPPPPIPAFQPNAPAAGPTANTGTPLAELHAAPPAPAPAHAAPKPQPKPKAPARPAAVQRARAAVKLPKVPGFGVSLASTPAKTVSVSELQGIVNSHGGALKRDGLYGPKTAAAWSALAKQRGLPTTIARTGSKTAKVAVQTYEQLSMPAIP